MDFMDMKKGNVVTFPEDADFPDTYVVEGNPYLSLTRPAGIYEIKLKQIV